jgi:NhaP-type Na+/H+ or K+/H+ antiporter
LNRRQVLLHRLWRNAIWAFGLIVIALAVGIVGYVYFGDGISWPAAFADAAMILAGEGPLDQMKTTSGHLFEGIYALICGFLFFAIAGFALAPALHHILRSFHLEDEERAEKARKAKLH